jgi:hypothetical protein
LVLKKKELKLCVQRKTREREKERKKERKNRENIKFVFVVFLKKKLTPAKNIKKIKKYPDTRVTGLGCPFTLVSEFSSKTYYVCGHGYPVIRGKLH